MPNLYVNIRSIDKKLYDNNLGLIEESAQVDGQILSEVVIPRHSLWGSQ